MKNTFFPDLTIFRTWVCSGDSATSGSSVTGSFSAWLDEGSLGAEDSGAVDIGEPSGLEGKVGAGRSVEDLNQV